MFPCFNDKRHTPVWNAEFSEAMFPDNVVARREEKPTEFLAGLLNLGNLVARKLVIGTFRPIGHAISGMPQKAEVFEPTLPIPAWLYLMALHANPTCPGYSPAPPP